MFVDVPKIKTYATQINKHFGTDVVAYNSPRNAHNLPSLTGRVEGGLDGFSVMMKQIFGKAITIEKLSGDIATRISGKYDSFSVAISKSDGFYFRSIIGDKGSLADKDLTPTKLGLNGATLNKQNFDTVIEAGLINNSHLPMEVISLGYELLHLSKNTGLTITTTAEIKKLVASISSTDLKKFGKNFGEIIIANWCLYNKKNVASIYFPEEENNPLADFVVNYSQSSKIPPLNVSAKFEGGANASLNSIIQADSKPPVGATDKELKAFKAIMAVAYDKVIDGLLNAEQILDTPEYKALKKLGGGGTVTLASISKTVEDALHGAGISKGMKWDTNSKATKDKYEAFLNKMDAFYSTINYGGKPAIATIPKIMALGSGKYYHPVLYSFSVALANRFNSDPACASVLNKAAKSIKAEQLYLNISNENISIKVKVFEDSQFEFAAGAFAYAADNVRMKVKMLK